MSKCPQCLNTIPVSAESCPICNFSINDDIANTLKMYGGDGTDEAKISTIISDKKMTAEKWQKIKRLFEAAQAITPDKRTAFLVSSCGDDHELRNEVERLLGSVENSKSFLESPVIGEAVSLFEGKTLAIHSTTGRNVEGNFVAGTVLDERYRIIGMLGKGGMGEVYRAEDLKLDQVVALKFLPEKLEKDKATLDRFIGEVRTARQVSHQNVCKVYDIGDIDGKHFISMEYIDGDDLSQLLRRIGRLPSDKAAEISRQICFGLHAIHDAGILHRDLKPANVIIDSNGRAKITDFGIAGIEADIKNEEIRVGTPAYMSPEQITGKEVTTKSDIYSLGLLVYEIFTGKQAMQADSFDELVEKHKTTTPTNPSSFVENIDPLVEKTINRCLEKDPRERPGSALQVALALPGGDPLEAAIAAGETPSPEMVAAAPKKGALRPIAAIGYLAAFLVVAFGIIALNQQIQPYSFTPFEKSGEVLAERSRQILTKFGYTDAPADKDYEFVSDHSFLEYYGTVGNQHELPPRKEMIAKGQPYEIYFLYRQSPNYLEPLDSVAISENEPPLTVPKMVNLKLDVRGRLVELVAVPPAESPVENTETDWKDVFAEAGLDISKFEKVESTMTPPVFADQRAAWTGGLADFSDIPIRIEAAGLNGKPVYFHIFAPWDLPAKGESASENAFRKSGIVLLIFLIASAILGSFILAYRNIRVGRGDLRGGLKLTLILFLLSFVGQMLQADHIPTIWGEISIIYEAISYAGITAVAVGLLYIALEPFVRRSWSELLISWSRLLAGDFRDPMVGRDILVGGLLGFGHMMGIHIGLLLLQTYLGKFDTLLTFYFLEPLNGTSGLIQSFSNNIVTNTALGLILLFIALFFFLMTGKKYLGILAVGLLFFTLQVLIIISTFNWVMIAGVAINTVCMMIALGRYGLLGMISFWFFFEAIYEYPITFDPSSFYFPQSVLTILILVGIAGYSFYISIAGQPFIRNVLSEKFAGD